MQLNNKFIKSEFNNFLSSIQKETKQNNIKYLISFAFNIPHINISSLTNSNNLKTKNYFYWKIESENEEFIGLNSVLNINEFGEDRINKTAHIINNVESNFISNWDELGLNNLPLVMGGYKFAPNQKSELWEDFSDADWFVPNYIFYKCEKGAFAVFNSFIYLEEKDHIIDSFKSFLEILSDLTDDL